MTNAPFSSEFESLARQYWNTWNDLLGSSQAPSAWGRDPWSLIGSMPPGVGRFDPSALDWLARIQQLAGQFSTGSSSAAEVARAWRQLLGGEQANPFAGLIQSAKGGLAGANWLEQMRPLLDMLLRPMREQQADWLRRPAFGPAREHQERLQALALAWQDWEQRNEAFNVFLTEAGQTAFSRFEDLLSERDAPGKRLESARALFDLWIDAAEEAWAEIALSDDYRKAYAEMTNALMRLRLSLQREIEQIGAAFGLPGRSELDALHRKVAELERALHKARRAAPATVQPASAATAVMGAKAATASPAQATSAGKAAVATEAAAATQSSPPVKPARKVAGASKPSPSRKGGAPSPAPKREAKPVSAKPAVTKASATRAGKAAPVLGRTKVEAPAAARKPARPSTTSVAKSAGRRANDAAAAVVKKVKAAPASKPAKVSKNPVSSKQATKASKSAKVAPAARKAVASPSARVAATPAKVVSMKDWVSRNSGSDNKPVSGRRGGRK